MLKGAQELEKMSVERGLHHSPHSRPSALKPSVPKSPGASRVAGSPSQQPAKSSKVGLPSVLPFPGGGGGSSSSSGAPADGAGKEFGKIASRAEPVDLESEASVSDVLAAVQAMRLELGDSLGQIRAEIAGIKAEMVPRNEFASLAERVAKLENAPKQEIIPNG